MSRIGRMPIAIPAGVTVEVAENNKVTVKGPKGTLERVLPKEMDFYIFDFREKVTDGHHFVVVIADGVENGEPVNTVHGVHVVQVLGEVVVVAGPVLVPGHVSQGDAVDGFFRVYELFMYFGY